MVIVLRYKNLFDKIKTGDTIILAVITVIAGFLFVLSLIPRGNSNRLSVQVRIDGKSAAVLPLNTDTEFDTGSLIVVIEGGTARVENPICKDKLCQKQGNISRPGQSIVCLPSRIAVTISGKSDVDGISY